MDTPKDFTFRGAQWASACGCLAGVFADPRDSSPVCTLCGANWIKATPDAGQASAPDRERLMTLAEAAALIVDDAHRIDFPHVDNWGSLPETARAGAINRAVERNLSAVRERLDAARNSQEAEKDGPVAEAAATDATARSRAFARIEDLESALFGVLDSGVCRCGPECPEDCKCSFGVARRLMQDAPVPNWRDVEMTDLRRRIMTLETALWPFSIQPHSDWCAFVRDANSVAATCNCGRYEAWRVLGNREWDHMVGDHDEYRRIRERIDLHKRGES